MMRQANQLLGTVRIVVLTLVAAMATSGFGWAADEGFAPLFNGKDLSGWQVRQSKEDLRGKTTSSDGRFVARDGAIVIQGAAKIEDIDTVARFGAPFVLRLEFRASDRANSGLYLRGKQLQVRDYATVGPYTQLKNYKKGDWNAIEVIVTTDPASRVSKARCTCNGELLEAELEIPAEGPIGLQSETNRLEYRNIRIKVAAASAAPVPTAP